MHPMWIVLTCPVCHRVVVHSLDDYVEMILTPMSIYVCKEHLSLLVKADPKGMS